MLTSPHFPWPRRSMDRTKVSGTFDVGSIPAGARLNSCLQKQEFFFSLSPPPTRITYTLFSKTNKAVQTHRFLVPPRGLEPRTN